MVKVKEVRDKVRKEVTISYKELANKFPELPKQGRIYGCHAWNHLGGWTIHDDTSIVITVDFEESIK